MAADQFDEKAIRQRENALKSHSEQIGRLCILWSGLELDIAYCLVAVCELDDRINKNVLMGVLDMPKKIKALKAIAFERKPSDEWYKRLEDVLNEIDNEFRNRRNRLVHDYWISMQNVDEPQEIIKMQLESKISKVPNSSSKFLSLAELKPVTAESIAELCEKVISANANLIRLRREFEHSPLRGRPEPRRSIFDHEPN